MAELDHMAREELDAQLTHVPEARTLIDVLFTPSPTPTVEDTALDRRRLGVTPEDYEALADEMGQALSRALALAGQLPGRLTEADERELLDRARGRLIGMAAVARRADVDGIPPATAAEVTGVLPLFIPPEINGSGMPGCAVYLEAPAPVDYLSGQSLPVLRPNAGPAVSGAADALQQQWEELVPAVPPNDYGQLVFFLLPNLGDGGQAGPIRVPGIGEYWTFGEPRGDAIDLTVPAGALGVTFTVDGTGERLPGARAAVFELVGRMAEDVEKQQMRVNLLVDAIGANEPGIRSLAEKTDWLSLTLF